jgi:uncharacterized MAPEG superfamily protein
MSIELTLLIWSAALAIVQILVAFVGTTLEFGLPDIPGQREKLPPPESFSGRAHRAGQNMLESLVLFAVLVLATEATNRNNASTELILSERPTEVGQARLRCLLRMSTLIFFTHAFAG